MDLHDVYAPVKVGDVIKYKKLESPGEVFLDFDGSSKIPPKSILFPQREVLFTFEIDEKGAKIQDARPANDPRSMLLFGIRPCDMSSFNLLKRFFEEGEFKDPYYLDRYSKSVFVTFPCNTPMSTCFCPSVGGDPFDTAGGDLQLVDLGDEYMITSTSERGATVLEQFGPLPDAGPEADEALENLKREARRKFQTELDLSAIESLLDGKFEDDIWKEWGKFCLGCASCSFLCPTCHCFDVVDEKIDARHGARVRLWDTCQFPIFTKHASGHNPRPDKSSRVRQRLYHKFNYYPKNLGVIACVGCGRCVNSCPMNSDLRDELTQITGGEKKEEVVAQH
ncbi:MAG: 4Fe-4S dicluster domain-containing protein [Promethearchaeota archaeon]